MSVLVENEPRSPQVLAAVRRAVRGVVQRAPELADRPDLRRKLAERMVRVSLAAADLIDQDNRLTRDIAGRSPAGARPLAASLAAGDFNRQQAVSSAAGVLRGTRDAIDFPGFVTSLVTGVFQAMTTSTIQQLQAYADLLEAVTASGPEFAAAQITPGRAAQWAAARFPAFVANPAAGEEGGVLTVRDDGDMPDSEELAKALEATEDEVSSVDDADLDGTLIPLIRRKLGRDRQAMLATMVLQGMNRVIIDDGQIEASMDLAVDARSTAEQTTAERLDTRVTTSASGSFGMGVWGASASLSATVGYVKSDEQFSREDMRIKAGLRSRVSLGFHTEPFQLGRMASQTRQRNIQSKAMNPEAETPDLLGSKIERNTSSPKFDSIPAMPTPADPGSQAQRDLRAKKDFGPKKDEPKKAGDKAPAKPQPKKTAGQKPDNQAADGTKKQETGKQETVKQDAGKQETGKQEGATQQQAVKKTAAADEAVTS